VLTWGLAFFLSAFCLNIDANNPAAHYSCCINNPKPATHHHDPLLQLFVKDPNALIFLSIIEDDLPISQIDLASIIIAQEIQTQTPLPASKPKVSPATTPTEPNKIDRTSALAMHALCADFFSTYIDDYGRVDYKTLRRKRLDLISAQSQYSDVKPDVYNNWAKEDKLAFWINTFNLCIIRGIVDNYPIIPSRFKVIFYPANSIMQIDGIWDKMPFNIMGENYTLTEIEQKILRTQFEEPRICLAISYASEGSAPMRREPYTGAKLDGQLNDQAKRFLATEIGFKIDRNEPALYLSPVFDWYSAKFVAKYPADKQFLDKPAGQASILTYVSKHVSRKDADWLGRKIFSVKWIRFNWMLNEQR